MIQPSHKYAHLPGADTRPTTPQPRKSDESITIQSLKPEQGIVPCIRDEDTPWLWVHALLPLIGHLILITGVAAFVFWYIEKQKFNLSSRSPLVTQVDGSQIRSSGFQPLQSDITTILSFALTITRTAAAMWTAATAWRCIFVLMEEPGISLRAINWITTYRLPVKPRTLQAAIVALILLTAFPSQLSSPILTGSITWAPAFELVKASQPVEISSSSVGQRWDNYKKFDNDVERAMLAAVGVADTAWGTLSGNRVTMKRVLRNAQHLPVNSSLETVRVPYFAIHSFKWIKDPTPLSVEQKQTLFRPNRRTTYTQGIGVMAYVAGLLTMGFIPNKSWDPSPGRPFPPPTTFSETGILAILYDHIRRENETCNRKRFFGGLPEDVGDYQFRYGRNQDFVECMVYAEVAYTAGAAVCEFCNISVSTVVQTDTDTAVVVEDAMTVEALALMPKLLTYMYMSARSVPSSDNITDYAIRVLPRSYGAAWTALTDMFASPTMLETSVRVPVSMSQAVVDRRRVYLWLALNILLTLSGVMFVFVQRRCKKPLVVDTAIAALLLDTSRALENDERGLCDMSRITKEDSKIGSLRLRVTDNGHRYVDVDRHVYC